MKTEVNLVSVIWTRKRFPLILNGVMENVLVGAHLFFKTGPWLLKFTFIMQLFRFWGYFKYTSIYAQTVLWGL